MDLRPSKDARFMMQAELESMWSTCQRLQVGAVLADDEGSVLLSARNGVPRGQLHCNGLGTLTGRCVKCVHSETNLINHAARIGIALAGKHVTTLYRPCVSCANNLIQANIKSLNFRHHYDTDGERDYVLNMFRNSDVVVTYQPMTLNEQRFSKLLKIWKDSWGTTSSLTQYGLDWEEWS